MSTARIIRFFRSGLTTSMLLLTILLASPKLAAAALPTHVLTADYVATHNGTKLPPTSLAPWLTWASTTWQANGSVVAAGIKTMLYTDPNRLQPADPMYAEDESLFAHACDGSRIKSTHYDNQYLMDPTSANLREQWKKHVASRSEGAHWDAIFDDDANDVLYMSALPCNYSPQDWLKATKLQISALRVPVVYNGLQLPDEMKLNELPNVIGGMYEACYADSSKWPKSWENTWSKTENVELAMGNQRKLFFCLGTDDTSAPDAIDGRLYMYASFLLTYSPRFSIIWALYDSPSKFHVEPETRFVPLDPIVKHPRTVEDLKLATGLYAREYKRCSLSGLPVGRCAIVVNSDRDLSLDYPYGSRYSHTLKLSGGGILDGGSVAANGAAAPSSVPPLTALIVIQ